MVEHSSQYKRTSLDSSLTLGAVIMGVAATVMAVLIVEKGCVLNIIGVLAGIVPFYLVAR